MVSRMYEKLKNDDGLHDHEILEILLFNAFPRKNTNPVAHSLLQMFGSLSGVFAADIEQLMSVDGVGESPFLFRKKYMSNYRRAARFCQAGKCVKDIDLALNVQTNGRFTSFAPFISVEGYSNFSLSMRRTGICAMLLESILGVDENLIIQDYCISDKFQFRRRFWQKAGLVIAIRFLCVCSL